MSRFVVIIPARYASTRLPGKPLVDIGGLPMVIRVAKQVQKVKGIDKIIVATDHQTIFDVCVKHQIEVVLTAENHPSGTDRICEAAQKVEKLNQNDVIINVQGDEPFIKPEQIEQLALLFDNDNVKIGTLIKSESRIEEIDQASKVKVVVNKVGQALYFSRSAIPFYRDENEKPTYFTHVGMYAYRLGTLLEIAALPQSKLEKAESLEQLRWLENGYTIHTAITDFETYAVDTPTDLENIRLMFANSGL
jgi:3-deoxy-manno-octulosonate cytidylyltransferase (CMP-KDO synthetase)